MMATKNRALLHGRSIEMASTELCGVLAQQLLQELGAAVCSSPGTILPEQEIAAWRDSGLQQISPRRPAHLPLASVADAIILAMNGLFDQPRIDLIGRRLLGMRRLSHPLRETGTVSANGSCHLIPCGEQILAVNLARPDDWDLLPAWLEDADIGDWEGLRRHLQERDAMEILERARLLGLPVALSEPARDCWWFQSDAIGQQSSVEDRSRPFRVLDLSALWAGPLCSKVLHSAGAQVVRIENPHRPDGARLGPEGFFSALGGGKQTVALDLATESGQRSFHQLLQDADLVLESSRPRALQQLGLDAEELLQQYPGLSWLSITGYGRQEPQAQWVAFGDDAAVAGGLSEEMAKLTGQAQFCGDAIADPLTGLHSALLAMAALQAGGGYLLSVAMRDVVSSVIQRGHALRLNG